MVDCNSYDLVEFGEPFVARKRVLPSPKGTEVLIKVRRSGVCHSDIHIGDGYFDLGEQGKLRMVDRGMKLPLTMGHEIVGEIIAAGADAVDAPIGATVLVYPWIGCGQCHACKEERDNDCMKMRIIGLVQNGGYATHVRVEHSKYLIDVGGLDLDTVAPHACSGLTVYNAFAALGTLRASEWLAITGSGGLGLNAVAIGRALGYENIVVLDISNEKLNAAREMGANAVLNSGDENTIDELAKITGNNLAGVLDTVGISATAQLAVRALIKTGRYVVVGLHGGDFKMPLPWLPQKAMTVRGCHVGSLGQLRELIALIKTGKVRKIPVTLRPLSEVNDALDDLKKGRVTGRVVLDAD